jgi:hypothetical protein
MTLQKEIEEILTNLPKEMIGYVLDDKLNKQGIKLSRRNRQRVKNLVCCGKTDLIRIRQWRFWNRNKYKNEFTEDDIQNLEKFLTDILPDAMPKMIESVTDEMVPTIIQVVNRRWRRESRYQARESKDFRQRLFNYWRYPLGLLQMLLAIAREYGATINEQAKKSPPHDSTNFVEVLTGLQARACQIVDEIITLLSAGFSDGAMARWRTLHEVAVMSMFIRQHGEEVAERYILHERVESKKALNDYLNCYTRLGFEPLTEIEIDSVDNAYRDVIDRFGTDFKFQYGWASHQLKIKNPTFKDIEQAVEVDYFRAHYRMASHSVHANPKGVFFKLGLIDEMELLLAGPSNAGLADPGQGAAISLLQASAPLFDLDSTVDNLVVLKVMVLLGEEIKRSFAEAHENLENNTSPDFS